MKGRLLQFTLLLALLLLAPAGRSLRAETPGSDPQTTYALQTEREPVTSLEGEWRFQPGDDPRWADPAFDDSHWALVPSDGDWDEIGYRNLHGPAWYRFHLTVPPGDESYSLYLPVIYTSYQVFVDGKLVLTQGHMPPHASAYRSRPLVVDLPLPKLRQEAQTLTVALRIWHTPTWSPFRHGGLQGLAKVGRSDLVHNSLDVEQQAHLWQYSDEIDLGLLEMLATAVAATLFLTRKRERDFLWFALLMFAKGADHGLNAWSHIYASGVLTTDVVDCGLRTLFLVAALMFFRTFFAGKWSNAFVFALASCGLGALASPLSWMGTVTVSEGSFIALGLNLPVLVWVVLFTRKQARLGQVDARILRGPVTFLCLASLYTSLLWALETSGLTWLSEFNIHSSRPFYFTLNDVAEVIFLIAMLAILLRRFTLRSREQDRVHSEIEAARSVQQVLVPETLPDVPGLRIDTAYHPAQEVGGDFFQILPLADSTTLIVIGDVAGKGLPAALQVSLVVGTLRTLAERTTSPAQILAGLNRSLQGRGPGFTTCLALTLSAERTVLTFSNAGHIAPYVNGFELRTEPNLPLGIVPEIDFPEVRYDLQPGDHIAVLTDGVPEAMHGHELFGFDRTGQLSRETADTIAAAARRFGQSDDITVLTVDIVPVPASHTEQIEPVLQPA